MLVLYLVFLWVATSAADPNSQFSPVQSLAQEDAAGLTGLSYNETQPPVDNPSKFEGVKIAILVAHCFEEVILNMDIQPELDFNLSIN